MLPALNHSRQIPDVAKLFNVGQSTVRGWVRRGAIGHFRDKGIIRFSDADIVEFALAKHIGRRGPNAVKPEAWARVESIFERVLRKGEV